MRAMPSTKMKLNPAIELGKQTMKLNPAIELGKQTTDGQGEHEAIPKSPSLKAFKKLPTWSNEK